MMAQVFFISLFLVFAFLALMYAYIGALFFVIGWAANLSSKYADLIFLAVLGLMIAIPVATIVTVADLTRGMIR